MEAQAQQRQAPPQSKTSRPLSSDELAEIIKEASRRQGDAITRENAAAGVATLEDAYALAQELGIPPEYVTEAASNLARSKASTDQLSATRKGRLKTFLTTALVSVVGFGAAAMLGAPIVGLMVIAVVLGGLTLATLLRWLSSTMGSPGTNEVAPVPGRCRVCMKPAFKPESTFCEEHRYKGGTA